MIKQEDVFRIGQLGKPHGVKGEISFNFTDDIFDRTDECEYLVGMVDGILVPFYIEEYRFKTDTVALIKFEGVDTSEQARVFTGMEIFFPKEFAAEPEELSWSYFVGFQVFDVRYGILGVIAAVDEATINTLFVITQMDGNELLIPAQEVFIVDIDHRKRSIKMDLPEGMIENH
ncbi:MAG: 16S rRNA processing protein RimM [Bacteroidaceae bacterium]|nr:16S rRNA processing protein RimM [Bacteroidaceae bacterium]